jgi:UPF0042 nucleotide-binding protein
MKLYIISGRSGSGKSTVLHVLEDLEYNCVDNLPVGLLPALIDRLTREPSTPRAANIAVSIDARNLPSDLQRFPDILVSLDRMDLDCEIIYLDAASATLVKRFSETRRKHPLTDSRTGLREALDYERELLEPIADLADLSIDTTNLSNQALSEMVRDRIAGREGPSVSLLFLSFAYKRGVPVDADIVFDVRCLPNPHWIPVLRPLTGRDGPVIEHLRGEPAAQDMLLDIGNFLERWLPSFERSGRSYITVAIGCTGGQHRSVFIAEQLTQRFAARAGNTLVRHRELDRLEAERLPPVEEPMHTQPKPIGFD